MLKEFIMKKRPFLVAIFSALSFGCALAATLTGTFGVKAHAENAENTYITGVNLTLNENIVVKYHVTVPEDYTSAKMEYTYRDATYTQQETVATSGEIVFSFAEVTPQYMTEEVAVTLTLSGEGQADITESATGFSVKNYCQKLLKTDPAALGYTSQEKYSAMKTLVADLLNYGGQAQLYTNTNTTNLPTDGLTAAGKNAMTEFQALAGGDYAQTGTVSEKVSWKGANLYLDSTVNPVWYFTATDTEGLSLKVTVGGATRTITEFTEQTVNGTQVYRAEYKGLSVADFDELMMAQLYVNGAAEGKLLTYSVKTYVYNTLNNANASDEMKSLAKAIYNYGLSARAFSEEEADPTLGEVSVKFDDVYELVAANQKPNRAYNVQKVFGFGKLSDMSFVANMVTDGSYIYALASVETGGTAQTETINGASYTSYYRYARIVKYDPATNQIVGYSEQFYAQGGQNGLVEAYTAMYLKDGSVYVYDKDHKVFSVATSELSGNNVALTEEPNAVAFENAHTARSIYYDETNQRYAVLNGTTVTVYNAAGENVKSFSVAGSVATTDFQGKAATASCFRLSGSEGCLFVLYRVNGVLTPVVNVYGWGGELIDTLTIPVTTDILGNTVNGNYNVPAIAAKDGTLYAALITWSGNNSAIFKTDGATYDRKDSLGETVGKYSVEYTDATVANWGSHGGTFSYNATTDGTYMFMINGTLNQGKGNVSVVRMNVKTGTYVASKSFYASVSSTWESVPVFYKDGYVYTYGSASSSDTAGWIRFPVYFASGEGYESVTDLTFQNLTAGNIGSVYYDASVEKYAVLTNGDTVYTFDKKGNALGSFTSATSTLVPTFAGGTATVSIKRLAGAAGYIYVHGYNQGTKIPVVNVYDWNGTFLGEIRGTNEKSGQTKNGAKMEAVVEIGSDLYFSVLRWEGGNNTYVGKCSYTYIPEKPFVDLGEYYETNLTEGYTADYKVTHLATVGGMYNHGLCTDGTYLYVADSPEIDKVRIRKVDVRTGNVVATTTSAVTKRDGLWVGGDYLFYKGGYVYNVDSTGKVWCIAAESIGADGAALEEVTFTIDGFSGTIKSVSYNVERNAYAVMNTAGKVYVVDAATMTIKVTMAQTVSGTRVGIYCDANYVYALQEGAVNTPTICVYDYTGRYIGTCTDMTTGVAVAKNNVQSICSVGGTVYVLVCQYEGSTDEGGNTVARNGYIYAVTPQFTNWQ